MNQIQLQELSRRLGKIESKLAEIGELVNKHEDAYNDYVVGKKWILRLGIATLVSAVVSPHIKYIIEILKMILN